MTFLRGQGMFWNFFCFVFFLPFLLGLVRGRSCREETTMMLGLYARRFCMRSNLKQTVCLLFLPAGIVSMCWSKIKSTQRKLSSFSETQRLHARAKAGVANLFELKRRLLSGESYTGRPVCYNRQNTFFHFCLWFNINNDIPQSEDTHILDFPFLSFFFPQKHLINLWIEHFDMTF